MTYLDRVQALLPVSYWPCDDGGSSAPVDLAGVYNFGLAPGSTAPVRYVADAVWGTVLAGGDYSLSTVLELDSGLSVDWSSEFTVGWWVKVEPGNNGSGPDTAEAEVLSVWSPIYVALDDNLVNDNVVVAVGDAVNWVTTWGEFPSSTSWAWFGATWDGTTLTGWRNSIAVCTTTGAIGTLTPTDLSIRLVGEVAHLVLFDRALTLAEISVLSEPPPPEPTAYAWDTFTRADAATLGTATPIGEAWSAIAGSWAIDTNKAAATGFSAGSAKAVLLPPAGTGPIQAVQAVLTCPSGSSWSAGIGIGDNAGIGVQVSDAGWLAVVGIKHGIDGLYVPGWGADVDVSPGDHRATVEWQQATPGEVRVLAWWDGVLVVDGSTSALQSYRTADGVILSASSYPDTDDVRWDAVAVALEPIYAPSVPAPALAGGVTESFQPSHVVFVGSVAAPALVGGALAPLTEADLRNIAVGSVQEPPLTGGVRATWSDTPPASIPSTPPHTWPPGVQYGAPADVLTVVGYPDRTQAACRPEMNGPGSGSFTTPPPGPGVGASITFRSGGQAVFSGSVESVTTVVADQSEEAGQLVSVEVSGHLAGDWGDTVVWPDFGAYEPIRAGAPAQDEREWGFPMNGLLPADLSFTGSHRNDPSRYGTPLEIFPVPPDWPDSSARYMWDRDPDKLQAPQGWCYFRVPFGSWPGKYTLFVNAFDYARVWIDGQPVATCDQPGTTVRTELDLDWDFHLMAVAGWNSGGKAGVMLSLLPKGKDGFGPAVMNSRAGWLCLSYPKQPMRATTGKILRRLVDEALARKAPAGEWACAFSDDADSRGRPWPTDGPLVTTKVGQTYLDVLHSFAEDRIDFWPSPAGKTLYAVVKDSAGVSHAAPWVHAVDADSIAVKVGAH